MKYELNIEAKIRKMINIKFDQRQENPVNKYQEELPPKTTVVFCNKCISYVKSQKYYV